MSLIPGGFGSGAGFAPAYPIANSVRFRASAGGNLNRTPSGAGSLTTWTLSLWVKRGTGNASLTSAWGGSSPTWTPYSTIQIDADRIIFDEIAFGPTILGRRYTTANDVFRDPAAWYHLVFVWDTTNATAANRMRMYVNGAQITTFATAIDPALNQTSIWNSTAPAALCRFATTGQYGDVYLAEVNFVNAQALDASSFGQTDSNGVWTAKAYTGSYGTNGFYLKFNNGSSVANLGLDSSGNGNTWTVNNVSLTAGATYDWMTDTPTNNFAVLNAALNQTQYNTQSPKSTSGTIANCNLTVTGQASNWNGWTGTFPVSSGQWYWEVLSVAEPIPNYKQLGIISESAATSYVAASGASTVGDIHGFALDLNAGTFAWFKNNVSQGTLATGLTGSWLPYVTVANSAQMTFNFGQRPFAYTPPAGFVALCTPNLPSASISDGGDHMTAITYTGTGATRTVSGYAFPPDLVWIKARSQSYFHQVYDTQRGVQQAIYTNDTNAETTETTGLTAFTSSGFTVGTGTGVNQAVQTYVGWAWRANGAAVTNTAGTLSSQVSANTQAGVSVVTLTAPASGSVTIGHGLGVAPKFIIVKATGSTGSWVTYHSSFTSNRDYILLNSTAAKVTSGSIFWNDQFPSATVFGATVANSLIANATHVAYCFAEVPGFSKFGSYTGNGVADGPFVYCGFRPRYVLIKCSSSDLGASAFWVVKDTARSPLNTALANLYPNLTNLEDTTGTAAIDILSNGFKIRGTYTPINSNANTLIYIAFAENPFGGSNVNPATAR